MDAFLPYMQGGRLVLVTSGASWQVKFDNKALYDRAFPPTLDRSELDQMAKEYIVRVTYLALLTHQESTRAPERKGTGWLHTGYMPMYSTGKALSNLLVAVEARSHPDVLISAACPGV